MAKKPLKVSSESLVFEKIPEGIYPIYESDWKRLKGMTGNIKSPRKWCCIIGSAMFGVSGSSLIQLIYNYSQLGEGEEWNDHTMFIVLILSLITGVFFFVIDKERNDSISDAGSKICEEMTSIENKYRNPIEDASMQSEPHLKDDKETAHPEAKPSVYIKFSK